jgi:hypothetical protein
MQNRMQKKYLIKILKCGDHGMHMQKIHNCSMLKLIYASMRSTMDYNILEKIGVYYLNAKFLFKKTFFGSCLGPFPRHK